MFGRGSKSAKKPAEKKPAKAAKPVKAKAPAPKRSVVMAKAKNDVYTVMLGLSFLATLLAVIFLAAEAQRYKWDMKGENARVSAVVAVSESAYA